MILLLYDSGLSSHKISPFPAKQVFPNHWGHPAPEGSNPCSQDHLQFEATKRHCPGKFSRGIWTAFFFGYKKPEVLTRFNPEKGILKHYQKEAGSISSMAFRGFHLLLNLENVKKCQERLRMGSSVFGAPPRGYMENSRVKR